MIIHYMSCFLVSDENANLGTAMRYEEIGESSLRYLKPEQAPVWCPLVFLPAVSELLLVCLYPVNMLFTEDVSLSSCLFVVCRVTHLAPVWQ